VPFALGADRRTALSLRYFRVGVQFASSMVGLTPALEHTLDVVQCSPCGGFVSKSVGRYLAQTAWDASDRDLSQYALSRVKVVPDLRLITRKPHRPAASCTRSF